MNQIEIDDLMEEYWQPAIMLHRPYPPTAVAETNSHLGGLPALPPGVDWPRTSGGTPLHFLAQIDCADLPPTDDLLPDEGVLFFFARVDEEMLWGAGHPHEDCRVLFFSDSGDLPPLPPSDLPIIMGGYSDFQRDFLLPDEPGLNIYPQWPIVGLPIGSWPDATAIPDFSDLDLDGYQEAVARSRAAEAVRVTGLPTNTGFRPHWGVQVFDGQGCQQITLPNDTGQPFPQAWVMVDRISRRLANWSRSKLEKETAHKSPIETEQLHKIHESSLAWVQVAADCGLDEAPGDKEGHHFKEWLSALAGDSSTRVRSGVANAVTAGMVSAVQYTGGSAKAASLLPPRYFNELENNHLPTRSEKFGYLAACEPWRLDGRYHQMLGHAGSSQHAPSADGGDILLLQLISDVGIEFMFCDLGEVEFRINEADLAARRFDRVAAATCGG